MPKLCALKVMLHKPARRRSRNQFGNKLGGSLHEAKRGLVRALQLCKSQSGSRKGLYTYTLNEQLLTFPPAFLQSCQSTTPPSRRGGGFQCEATAFQQPPTTPSPRNWEWKASAVPGSQVDTCTKDQSGPCWGEQARSRVVGRGCCGCFSGSVLAGCCEE